MTRFHLRKTISSSVIALGATLRTTITSVAVPPTPFVGVGTDLVDVARFRCVLQRSSSLVEGVFTPDERRYAELASDPTMRYAARFAAKEATTKALGVGIGTFPLVEIEVVSGPKRAPQLVLHGKAAQVAFDYGVRSWLVTLSHVDHVASAVVIALPQETR